MSIYLVRNYYFKIWLRGANRYNNGSTLYNDW